MSDFERDESGFYKPRDPFIGTTKITKEDIVQDFRSPADALPTTPTQPADEMAAMPDEEMIEAGYRALVACKPMTSTDCEREACEAIYTAMRALAKPDDGVVAAREALTHARNTFNRYAKPHRAKGTDDGDVKACANASMGEEMQRALDALASLATGDDGISQGTGK